MQIKPRKTNPNFMDLDLEILLMFNGEKNGINISPYGERIYQYGFR